MLIRPHLSAARARHRLGRARLRLRLARYWQANGDLDETGCHAHRALLTAARQSDRADWRGHAHPRGNRNDRCEYVSGHGRLVQLVDQLDRLPAANRAGRLLLARALTNLADAHRRAGRYPQATQTSHRACQLLEDPVAAQPDLLAAALTTLAITHKAAALAALHDFHALPTWQLTWQRHAQSDGESANFNTRDFDMSTNGTTAPVAGTLATGGAFPCCRCLCPQER